MSNQTTNDEDQQQSIANQRAVHSELLTKIYYPDTLYPDNYSFFADRDSSQVRSLRTNSNDQHPTIDSIRPSTQPITISNQPTIEIETPERQSKHSSAMIDRERGESESGRQRFDVKRYIPSALRAQDKSQPPAILLDPRFYSMKKTAMTIMCLLIIIMSNSVQLKHVLKKGDLHPFYGTQVALGIISVLMCACIGVILMYVMRIDINDQYKQHKLDYIDNCVICLVFILAIFNIFIAACS
ncbi:unnamed protein product [Rotaria sordida]|uniref:Uncharacterized protein n=1 Tax=Rotaria sordida TaxID=392033 RepID=A0A814JS36_9BILA|nr:unnamed protein product [Rotaria sordida]CAF1041818.1 unnamed protein product [Rotaria sordida]